MKTKFAEKDKSLPKLSPAGNRFFSRDAITLYIVIIFYAVYSAIIYGGVASRQMLNVVITLSCYILLTVSLNLVVGFLGELSLGHAAFMSVGAYSGSMISLAIFEKFPEIPLAVRLPVSMILGGVVAAVFGVIIGIPVLRLNGDYLAIVTLAFGEIIKNIIINLDFTGGAIGFDTGDIYESPKNLFPFAAVAVILSVILVINLAKSKHGRAITAVRDNRIAADATGINITYYKLMVFVLAAFIAGVAGVIWGHSLSIIKAARFDFNMSIEILVIVVLGGLGSVRGSVIAAIIMTMLPELLRDLQDYRMLIYSILLILLMLFNASPKLVAIRERFGFGNIVKLTKAKVASRKKVKEVGENE